MHIRSVLFVAVGRRGWTTRLSAAAYAVCTPLSRVAFRGMASCSRYCRTEMTDESRTIKVLRMVSNRDDIKITGDSLTFPWRGQCGLRTCTKGTKAVAYEGIRKPSYFIADNI